MAARAADTANLCCFAWLESYFLEGKGWPYTPLRQYASPQAVTAELSGGRFYYFGRYPISSRSSGPTSRLAFSPYLPWSKVAE